MDDTRRPLDVLEEAVGTRVTVELKDGTYYEGRLAGYDQHMNLVVETDRTDGEVADGTESEGADRTGGAAKDTTVIRGDNVVSIQS